MPYYIPIHHVMHDEYGNKTLLLLLLGVKRMRENAFILNRIAIGCTGFYLRVCIGQMLP